MTMFRRGVRLAAGIWVLGLASAAWGQDNLDLGKSGAQLYAADCAICHKSPQGLNRAGGLFGLQSFLREHYTASRESAAVIAGYLQSVDRGPPSAPAHGRAAKRSAKGEEGGKTGVSKPHEKKVDEKKIDEKKSEPGKASEAKPADKPPESKSSDAKPAETKRAKPKASKPKPSSDAKPEKSE